MSTNINILIQSVTGIILKHAKPESIYLHGSYAEGEATQGSDIDIAYDAPGFKEHFLIADEVDSLETLVKIDGF
ncbi:nucleotidyltransferase domain-containing protein [bacterium]|nr:nucleotidyltransferase domain-containing protein [bacterium]